MCLRKTLLACASLGAFATALAPNIAAAQTTAGPQTTAEPASTLEEVVVTARKREESLQQIPVAVSSASGAQLSRQGIRETLDLQRIVPSLTIVQSSGNNTSAVFSLRGQAAGDILLTLSQPVGVYQDTVNIPHPDGLNTDFFDIARVEVLKGPQGTLYGRNTTGGAVNIITRGPDYNGYHGFANAEVGNYDDWKLGGAVNLPIVDDKVALRVGYEHWKREGFGSSVTTGQRLGDPHDDDIARVSLRVDPTSNISSSTKVEFRNLQQTGFLVKLVSLPAGSPAPLEVGLESGCGSFANIPALATCGFAALAPYLNNTNPLSTGTSDFSSHVKTWHVSEDLSWDITDQVRLRSITGYHSVVDLQNTDLDGTPFQILGVGAGSNGGVQPIAPFTPFPYPRQAENDYNAYTQEFDLSGHAFGHLDWLVGAFGSWEKGHGGEPFVAFADLSQGEVHSTTSSIDEKTDTWALFTQNDLHIGDVFSITAGARYTEERQENIAQPFTFASGVFDCAPYPAANGTGGVPFAAPNNNPSNCPTTATQGFPTREKANGISYLLSFNFQLTPDTLLYIKTARGFRGGALQFRAPQFPPVHPEIAVDYEIGFKSDFLEHRLRTNLAAYQTNYSNKQETQIIPVAGAPTTVLFNAASARIRGFEAEVTAVPFQGLSTYGTLTYLDGQYLSFPSAQNPEGTPIDASGFSFPDPRWRYSVGARYEHDIGPGKAGAQLDWAWHSHTIMTAVNTDPLFSTALQQSLNPSVGLLNGRIDFQLPDRGITVSLFATNLLNKRYELLSLFSGALGIGTAVTQDPRMFGISVNKTFGNE